LSIKSNSSLALALGRRHLGAALDEALALRVHLRLDLLAHGAAQQVGVAQRSPPGSGDLHHLFLIDDDAVGLLENWLPAARVRIFDALGPFLRLPKVGILSIGPGR
jgi:hypothetical protein